MGRDLVKVMKYVIIVPTNAFVLLGIAGIFNSKLYLYSMYKTLITNSYIFLCSVGTKKTALDPKNVSLCVVV